ncbi:MAG: hypothetical protein KAI85_04355 [Halopseudomonas aestusnigri]|nr:hypothetical protein [Halopseudomonas aestusnigri]
MKFIKQAKQLAAVLTDEFGYEDIILNVQMCRGEDWVNLDVYQSTEDPERIIATLDFDTGARVLLKSPTTLH